MYFSNHAILYLAILHSLIGFYNASNGSLYYGVSQNWNSKYSLNPKIAPFCGFCSFHKSSVLPELPQTHNLELEERAYLTKISRAALSLSSAYHQ